MNPLIECCVQNLSKGAELLVSDSFIQENSDLITYSCLSNCVLCSQKFYVLFEGERIIGDTPELLLDKIKKAINEWHAEMA